MKAREGYRHASTVLVNRTIRIDTDTDEAIRQICADEGRPFGPVARDILIRGLVSHRLRIALLEHQVDEAVL